MQCKHWPPTYRLVLHFLYRLVKSANGRDHESLPYSHQTRYTTAGEEEKRTPRSEPYCFVLQRSYFWTGEGKKKDPLLNNSQLAMILSRQFTTEGDREKPSPTSSSTLVKPTTIHGQSTQVKSSHSTSKFLFYLYLNILELSTRLLQFSSSLLISDL